jgi:serine/threonine-protein kinase
VCSIFTPPELNEFSPGTVIANRYEVLSVLGWGGMGLVLKAKDRNLNDEIIAVKLLYREFVDDEVILARFRREVILSRRLSHPNIVRVYDLGTTNTGHYFLTMEYVEGITLRSKLSKGALPLSEAVPLLKQIVSALEHAHHQDVFHRDLKPDNIILTADGIVKVTDFGTARRSISNENLTQTGDSIGTPTYTSPEMIQTAKGDHRSDIYALGVMAFEFLQGALPYIATNWVVLANMHVSAPIPILNSKNVPAWCQEFVNRAMAKAPADRFQSASEARSFLDRNSDGSEGVEITTGILVKVIAGVLLVIMAVVIFWFTRKGVP